MVGGPGQRRIYPGWYPETMTPVRKRRSPGAPPRRRVADQKPPPRAEHARRSRVRSRPTTTVRTVPRRRDERTRAPEPLTAGYRLGVPAVKPDPEGIRHPIERHEREASRSSPLAHPSDD